MTSDNLLPNIVSLIIEIALITFLGKIFIDYREYKQKKSFLEITNSLFLLSLKRFYDNKTKTFTLDNCDIKAEVIKFKEYFSKATDRDYEEYIKYLECYLPAFIGSMTIVNSISDFHSFIFHNIIGDMNLLINEKDKPKKRLNEIMDIIVTNIITINDIPIK